MATELYPDVVTNSSSVVTLLQQVNSNLVYGYLGVVICVAFFVIVMVRLNDGQNMPTSLAISTFLTSLLGVLLFTMNMLSELLLFGKIILSILGIIWLYISTREA